MKQKQLTQAIRDGLNQSREDFGEEILHGFYIAITIVIVGILVLYGFGKLQERQFCGSFNCYNQIPMAQIQSVGDEVSCRILDFNKSWGMDYYARSIDLANNQLEYQKVVRNNTKLVMECE